MGGCRVAMCWSLPCIPFSADRDLVQSEAATFGPTATAKVRVQSAKPNRILLVMRRGRAASAVGDATAWKWAGSCAEGICCCRGAGSPVCL